MEGFTYNKRSVLETFDTTPTPNSKNPVESGGVAAADGALSGRIDTLQTQVGSAWFFKGSTTYANLPASGNTINDTYYVTDSDKMCWYTWNGTEWIQSSMNQTGYDSAILQLKKDMASIYNPSSQYGVGDLVLNTDSNKLYVCKTAVTTPEAFDPSKWNEISIAKAINDVVTVSDTQPTDASAKIWVKSDSSTGVSIPTMSDINSIVAAEYDIHTAYDVGDYCMYDGNYYRCNTAIALPGESWTAGHWTQTNVSAEVTNVKNNLTEEVGTSKSATSNLYNGFDFGWVNGYIRGSDGKIVSGNTARTSVAFPFSFFPSFIVDSDAFKSVPTYNYFGLWSNGVYVGYWRNGKFYLPTEAETESIAFDTIRVVMSTASSPSYETLSFESVIEKFNKYVANASLPDYSFDYPITKSINIRANVGYVKLNGTTGSSQAGQWEYSDFIAIETSYKVTYYVLGATNVASVSFYDASHTLMPDYNVVAPDGTNMISGTVEAPDGAKFVRVCGFYANHTNEYAESETPITLDEAVQKVATDTNESFWSGKTIGFLGDSITKGLYTEVGESTPDKIAAKPYPIIVGEVLDAIILNYGVSGTSISSTTDTKPSECFIARAPGMDNNLDLIIVLGGTNDYATSVPLGTTEDTTDISFYGALDVLCNLLISKYPSKRIVFITPLLRDYMGHGEGVNNLGYTLEDIRKAISEVASDKYGLMVIDGKKIGLSPYNSTWRATYIYDGLHPNPIGHEVIGKNIARMLLAV